MIVSITESKNFHCNRVQLLLCNIFLADVTFLRSTVKPAWYLREAGSPSGEPSLMLYFLHSQKALSTQEMYINKFWRGEMLKVMFLLQSRYPGFIWSPGDKRGTRIHWRVKSPGLRVLPNNEVKEPIQTDGEGQLALERLNRDLPFLFHFKSVPVSTDTLALV